MVVVWTMLAIIAAFKAYPAAGDVALYLAVIPLILHLLEGLCIRSHSSTYRIGYLLSLFLSVLELKYGVVVAVGSIFCVILLPVMWRMWIMTGTGNANFYYALTLVIALGQSMLIADVIASVMKRDFLIMRKRKELSTTHNENGETKKSK
jgi:phosphatidylinositol glycan class U